MAEIRVELEITCAECGEELELSEQRFANRISLKPCEYCMNKAHEEGVEEGIEEREE